MRAAVVLPAGGAGLRMGTGGVRKQYAELAGEPILRRSMGPFLERRDVEWVVAVLPAEDVEDPPFRLPDGVVVVAGGPERGDSVRHGLDAVPAAADVVLIHDAARPLVSGAVIDRVLRAVGPDVGAVAALPVADTLKEVADGRITRTVDRSTLWRAQTPQGFPRPMIVDAYRRAAEEGVRATDDAALVERFGGRVVVVQGDPRNLKITRPEDLRLAELLLAEAGR
ncbi:MAG: 2-C-methyl-D-erythritol 4-phosphate cytidylyltransferase [Longimicrobiales bacterium]|nr:2-C-methyl-D-erythritol 4-phosphate cytidylyltransferase [Longimicrobiales bacterium]